MTNDCCVHVVRMFVHVSVCHCPRLDFVFQADALMMMMVASDVLWYFDNVCCLRESALNDS